MVNSHEEKSSGLVSRASVIPLLIAPPYSARGPVNGIITPVLNGSPWTEDPPNAVRVAKTHSTTLIPASNRRSMSGLLNYQLILKIKFTRLAATGTYCKWDLWVFGEFRVIQ
jgi:hypothetical protein